MTAHNSPPHRRSGPGRPSGRPTRHRPATVAVVIVVALAALVGVGLIAARSSQSAARDNTTAASWNLPALQGSGRISLAQFRGRPVVVNFFASWCSACDFELPGFVATSQRLRGKVVFVGIDALETGDHLFMVNRHHLQSWPLAQDVGGAQGSGLHDALGGGNSMPLTAFYDAQGRLVDVQRGALPEQALQQGIQQLFGIRVDAP